MITPRDFVDRWGQSALREQQGSQSHFNELCQLVGHKTPTQIDPKGEFFTFEEQVQKATGGSGRADVWYKGHFAWEYKGKHKDLDAAYAQLSAYRGSLGNPPLLVVCDFLEYRIYPQWPNISGQPIIFRNEDLLEKTAQNYIQWLLNDPDKFRELRQSELERREQLTLKLADRFAHLTDSMRQHPETGWTPMQIARFLTKLVFALFAEDVGLLPKLGRKNDPDALPALRYIAERAGEVEDSFMFAMSDLFRAMDGQTNQFMMQYVPYFNGGIFAESAPGADDGLEVLDLTLIPEGISILREVSAADWRYVNPTIFGTLFEGALDAGKRAQLGAHYTGESDIRLVVEPVLMQPLYRLWDEIRAEAEPLLQSWLAQGTPPRQRQDAQDRLKNLHDQIMTRLEQTRVLDPACGSGNFLYMSLRALKDLEAQARKFFEPLALPFRDVVTPRQLYGIEKDEFAANLARVVVWIGYLQWRYEDEGGTLHVHNPRKADHPRALPNPILKDKNTPDEPDRIICADAILRYDAEGKPYEPEWPEADVIVGNPPFLGAKWMQSELGEKYKTDLWNVYDGRINGTSDLVTYWFEKSRALIEKHTVKRTGLLATNTIRQGGSAEVLKRIKETGDIFLAYTDHPWTLKGASLRVALVGFDDGTETERVLNGESVVEIVTDLAASVDLTSAEALQENLNISFRGHERGGPFLVNAAKAKDFLQESENASIVHPWYSGQDLVGRSRDEWVIDFGDRELEEAEKYKKVFSHLKTEWDKETDTIRREKWWLHRRSAGDLRTAIKALNRFIATPLVSKHRLFVWLDVKVRPDTRLIAFSRSDDYFFGILHSFIHEIWALRKGAQHGGERPTYNNTLCFETFPFPYPPGKEDVNSPVHQAISVAAKQLNEERELWLNPPELVALGAGADSPALRERTLTNLYNALVAHRADSLPLAMRERGQGGEGKNGERISKVARDFAPRLAQLHDTLDKAVLAAYGWDDLFERLRTHEGDEELLRRLLALNRARAG
ncbi:MAG: class I SAM-dependent DNA methyltransferase [Anaerolineae bacterium]|nr:class I SAM-dependent DNA methyltransferase [Anaerolineae bacterium]